MAPKKRAKEKQEAAKKQEADNQTKQPKTPAAGGDRGAITVLAPGAYAVWQVPQVPVLVGTKDIRGVHVGKTPELARIPRHLFCVLRRYSTEAEAVHAYTYWANTYDAPLPVRIVRREDHGQVATSGVQQFHFQ